MTDYYKLHEICKKFAGNLISAYLNEEDMYIYLGCNDVNLLENEEVIELLSQYSSLIKRVCIKLYPDKNELNSVMEFKEKFPKFDIKIRISSIFFNYEVYKDGERDYLDDDLKIEQFEKLCELNEKSDGRCLYKISKSSNDSIQDVITIGRIYLSNVTDLDINELLDSFNEGEIDSKCVIAMPNQENEHYGEYDTYDMQKFEQIMQKLHEITDDIDPNLPELKKFAIVYDRIGRFIDYDYSILNIISDTDERFRKTRNLENGLLQGKCVCEGYAEILRNALKMVGIENYMIFGEVLVKTEDLKIEGFEEIKNENGEIVDYKGKDEQGNNVTYSKVEDGYWRMLEEHDGQMINHGGHAWNKIFIDGQMFYADLTYDSFNIKSNRDFAFIQSKEEIENDGKRTFNREGNVQGLSQKKKEELILYTHQIREESKTLAKEKKEDSKKERPSKLPYSPERIANGVMSSNYISKNLLVSSAYKSIDDVEH